VASLPLGDASMEADEGQHRARAREGYKRRPKPAPTRAVSPVSALFFDPLLQDLARACADPHFVRP